MSEPTDPAIDRADELIADIVATDDEVGAFTQEPEPESVTTPADADVSVIHPDSDETTFGFPKPFQKRVAIVGFAGGHAHLAPFDNPDIECWGINRLWKILPDKKFDRWFELHNLREFYENDPEHRAFLKQFEGPVYVRSQDYHLALEWGIETAQPYPDAVILDRFFPYFNNTVSWLIALAILMNDFDRHEDGDGYEWMGLYGIDMAQDHVLQAEYSQQRPSCEYFIGLATGRGIEIYIPHGADLLKATHLYGYQDAGPVLEKMGSRFIELGQNKEQIRGQILQAEAQIAAMNGQLSQMDGAMQELGYWRKNWLNLNDTPALPPAKGSPP